MNPVHAGALQYFICIHAWHAYIAWILNDQDHDPERSS